MIVERKLLPLVTAVAVALFALIVPAAAPAAVSVTSYKITSDLPTGFGVTPADGPSTLQAAAHPSAARARLTSGESGASAPFIQYTLAAR